MFNFSKKEKKESNKKDDDTEPSLEDSGAGGVSDKAMAKKLAAIGFGHLSNVFASSASKKSNEPDSDKKKLKKLAAAGFGHLSNMLSSSTSSKTEASGTESTGVTASGGDADGDEGEQEEFTSLFKSAAVQSSASTSKKSGISNPLSNLLSKSKNPVLKGFKGLRSAKSMDQDTHQAFLQHFTSLFNLHVFTPLSNSNVATQELDQLLKDFSGKIEPSGWCKMLTTTQVPTVVSTSGGVGGQMETHFDFVHSLKYLAKKHGLPLSYCTILLSVIADSTVSIGHKYQLAQIVKFSVANTKSISVKQTDQVIINLATNFGLFDDKTNGSSNNNSNSHVDPLVIKTISLLTQCILMTTDDTNIDKELDNLRRFLPLVDANTKVETLRKISTIKGTNGGDDKTDKFWVDESKDSIYESGESILVKLGQSKGKAVVADAVKTQQVVMSCTKGNMSEATDLENVNLNNALNKRRGKSTSSTTSATKKPSTRGGRGSDTSYWSTTGGNIDTLHKKAGNSAIKDDDIDWLVGKTDFGFAFTNALATMYQLERIAEIFQKAVVFQVLSPSTISKLAHNFFSTNLGSTYEDIRIKLLKTFGSFSKQQEKGKLPEAMNKTLTNFIKLNDCTRDMKRMIWAILMADDSNLHTSFKTALEQIVSSNTVEVPADVLAGYIEYITMQTVCESRAMEMEKEFSFFGKIVSVVLDKSYGKQARLGCSEIVEDFLIFHKSGLSNDLMDRFLSLSKSGFDQGTFVNWTSAEQQTFKASLIRCVLKTLWKLNGESAANVSEETLIYLIELCTREEDLQLEALIVVTLGNLVNSCSTLHFPNAELLLGKICRKDRISKETSKVYLELTDEVKGETDVVAENEDDEDDDKIYISGLVAKIVHHCVDKAKLSRNSSGIGHLVDAVENSSDKMTRILAARILFEISTEKDAVPLVPSVIDSLKPFTMHSAIYDVQVYCCAIYCTNIQKFYGENSWKTIVLSEDECDWLAKLYVVDGALSLGGIDFTCFVNPPILNVLKQQAKFLQFSHDTFQLMTFLLNEDRLKLDAVILEILENCFYCSYPGEPVTKEPRNVCPDYVFASIENIFNGNNDLLVERAGNLLYYLSKCQSCFISASILDHAYQVIMSTNEFSRIRLLCSRILFAGFCYQEVPPHIFRAFDSEFLVSRILFLLQSVIPSPDEKLDNILLYSLTNGKSEEIGASEKNDLIKSGLSSVHEYQSHGQRLSILHWTVFEMILKMEEFQSTIINCLIVASENGQSIPAPIIQSVFSSFTADQDKKYQLDIAQLALSLVKNNQILPELFVRKIIEKFCKETSEGMTAGDCEMYDQVLYILTNLAKQGKIQNNLRNLTQHLCNLYVNSKKINQKMGVVLKWKSLGSKTKNQMSFQEAAEIIGRLCKFWKKSRNHKHRIEILSGLYGIIGSEINQQQKTVNFESIKHCLVLAMTDKNGKTMESGLQTFLLFNSKSLSCSHSDFQLLLSIHSQPNLNQNIRDQLGEFLKGNLNKIPVDLQHEFEFHNQLAQLDDNVFLDKLDLLLAQSENFEIFQSNPLFYQRFLSILSAQSSVNLHCKLIQILATVPVNTLALLPVKIMDAVGLLLSKSDEMVTTPSKLLLRKFVDVGERIRIRCFSTEFFKYLTMSKDSDILVLGLNILEYQSHLFKGDGHDDQLKKLRFQLDTRSFFDNEIDADKLTNFIRHISSMKYSDLEFASKTEFLKILNVYVSLMDNQKAMVVVVKEEDLLVVLKLILSNFVRTFHSKVSNQELSLLSGIVVNAIRNFSGCLIGKDAPLCQLVCLSFVILVVKGSVDQLTTCLTSLTNLLHSLSSENSKTYDTIFACILSCIQFVCNSQDQPASEVVPAQTMELVKANLANPSPSIRLYAFRALLALENCDQLETDDDGVGIITGHIFQIFHKIFGGREPALEEMEKDISFSTDVAELLFSISYWDLKSLRRETREKWKRVLLTTNLITQFAKSDYEKLELMMKLRNYLNRKPDGDGKCEAEGILELNLHSLTLLLSKEKRTFGSFDQLMYILDLMELVPDDQLANILQNQGMVDLEGKTDEGVKPFASFISQLETAILTNEVNDLVPSTLSFEVLEMEVSTLLSSTGHNFKLVFSLLRKIQEVECITNLNELAGILGKIGGVDVLFKTVNDHILAQTDQLPLKQLILILQSHFLLLSVSQKTSERPDKLLSGRLAPICKIVLANGISLDQLQTFIDLTVERTCNESIIDQSKFHKIFDHVLFQLTQYQVTSVQLFKQLMLSFRNSDLNWHPPDIINLCNTIINNFIFDNTQDGHKQLDKIFHEFRSLNPHTFSYFLQLTNQENWDEIRQIFSDVKSSKFVLNNTEISEWTPSYILNCGMAIVSGLTSDDAVSAIQCMVEANKKEIREWKKADIKHWAISIKSGARKEKVSITEALVVANRAFQLTTTFHLTDIQILTCIIALLDKAKGAQSLRQGQLFQVGTGHGKSAIVGIIASLTCLLDINNGIKRPTVDIYTSSEVLAQRDAREWSEFFEIFGFSCGHNGDVNDRYISGEKVCYRNDIVYGDCSQFQFDYLRHHYSNLGTLGERSCSFAIIDEVDTMLIDDSSKLARLSSTIPGMDLIQVLYHCIWDRLSFIKTHLFNLFGSVYYLEGRIQTGSDGRVSYAYADKKTNDLKSISDIKAYIVEDGDLEEVRIEKVQVPIDIFVAGHLEKFALILVDGEGGEPSKIKLPKNLKKFAKSQIRNWVESSLCAVAYQENVHYIVDEGLVKPVDFKTTGVIQGNTSWNNGLHQFLQIKHGLKLTTESVTTNYLSNIAMFEKYKTNVVGFTGTLGSPASQLLLSEVYKVKLCIVPELHFKRYVRFPDLVVDNRENWLKEITLTSLEETSKRRGVLVICETIREAELVHATLSKFSHVKVKVYTKNQGDQEKHIERIHPGDIIVATNLAGRGTDIKTAEIEAYGGLHVILTFLPASQRIDEQAFGRTSRQGKKGTGQLIIVGNEYFDGTSNSGSMLVQQRDGAEQQILTNFASSDLPMIQLKDNLFAQFSETFKTLRSQLRDKERSLLQKAGGVIVKALESLTGVNLHTEAPSPTETIHLQAVEERWAIFLRDIDVFQKEKEKSGQACSPGDIQKKFNEFSSKLLDDFKEDKLIENSNNLYYFIQLGNHEYLADSDYSRALGYYEKAIVGDEKFAASAMVGKAFSYMKGRKYKFWFNSHDVDYKEAALSLLEKARPMLHEEVGIFDFIQVLIQRQHGTDNSTPLNSQIVEKVNLYGTYLKNVEAAISVIQKSMRRVMISGTMRNQKWNGDYVETRDFPDSSKIDSGELPSDFSGFDRYNITFHDLIVIGNDNDQLVNTIDALLPGYIERVKNVKKKATQFLKKWTGKKDQEIEGDRFSKISFAMKNVDPYNLLADLTNSKDGVDIKKFQFSAEILDVNFTNLQSLVSDLKSLEPGSYTLGFSLDFKKSEKGVQNFLKSLKNFEICVDTTSKVTVGKSSTFIDNTESPAGTKQLQELLEASAGPLIHIKVFLSSPNDVTNLVNIINANASLGRATNTSLTLHNVNKAINDSFKKSAWKNTMVTATGGLRLLIETGDANQGKSVVKILRKLNTDIILSIGGLPLDIANLMLIGADVEQEDIDQREIKELISTYCSNPLPLMELRELSGRGITLIVTFNEQKFVPWGSVLTIAGFAAVQAIAGGVLICTGFGASVGMSLITEGMGDLVTAHRIYTTREFSWSQYGTQKAISLTISVVSLGLNSLKDGAKGVTSLTQGAVKDTVLDAGKSVATGNMVLNETIKQSGTNLKSLAIKQIGMATLETGGRIALKNLADSLTDFCFEQVRDGIMNSVETQVNSNFCQPEFRNLLNLHFVLNKNSLENKLRSIVEATTNPKSSVWHQRWNSIGLPLCQGILSSPQFLGSAVSRTVMMAGFITGLRELATIINKVCTEILQQLQESSKGKVSSVLQGKCGLSMELAEKIGSEFEFDKSKFGECSLVVKTFPVVGHFEGKEQYEKVVSVWKKLEVDQKSFDFSTNYSISRMQRTVIDGITSHIIRIANSHFVSPVMSAGVGNLVAKISEELQDRFLVDHNQSTQEQKDAGGKVTFASQIYANAKDYMIAWQKRDIIAKVNEQPNTKDGPGGEKTSAGVKEYAEGVLEGKDADMIVMFTIAKENGQKIKIVDDKNYQPSPEEIASGVQIVIYEKNADPSKSGHYSLLRKDGTIYSPNSEHDCGFLVMAEITGKSVGELRVDAASNILANPDGFQEIQNTVNWVQSRYPYEATSQLMTGGAKVAPPDLLPVTPEDIEEAKRLFKENGDAFGDELTKELKDGSGVIYIYRKIDENGDPIDTDYFKIGMTEQSAVTSVGRVGTSERNNDGEIYQIVAEIPCDRVKAAESCIHKILHESRKPREDLVQRQDRGGELGRPDGYTEYFEGSFGVFKEVAERTCDTIDRIMSGDFVNFERQ